VLLAATVAPLSFEGRSPVPLLPSVASAATVDLVRTEEVGAASAPSGRRRNSKGKGSKGGGGDGGGRRRRRWRRRMVAVEVGVVPGVGDSVVEVKVMEAAAEVVEAVAAVVEAAAAVAEVAVAVVLVEVVGPTLQFAFGLLSVCVHAC
ncbi:unnamed protein product, partial [Closterium sp. NIES-54]